MVVADHLNAIRSLHVALLQYVSNWLPSAVQIQDSIVYAQENLQKLQRFLNNTVVNSEQEKRASARELYCLLEAMDDEQFRTVIVDCVEFCKHQLSADFSPLAQVLQVKNYKITGDATTESLAPLLRVLPFSSLVWQVLSGTARNEITLSDKLPSNTSCIMNDSSSLLYDSWFQNLLMASLKKEPMSKSIPLCRYLLLHLQSLKSKLLTVAVSVSQDNLQAAMLLCFELLQSLIQRLVEIRENSHKTDTNALDAIADDFARSSDIKHTVSETDDKGLSDIEYIIRTVFHHPVMLSCFLWYPEQSLPRTYLQDVSVQLTYHVSNLLLAVLPSLTWQQKRILMAPFVKKLISAGMSEIQSAQDGNETPSSQTFYLLGLFHSYCDKEEQVKFISSLCKLPTSLLLAIDSSSKERTPTAFLLTLLKFLEGTSPYEDRDSHPSFTLCKDVILEREEPLSVSHFMQLVKISNDVNCPQLDSINLQVLQASLTYVQASTATVLNSCFLHPTEVKVSIASYLVTHSPALRSHFELCCLSRSNFRKNVKGSNSSSVVSIEFKDHLREFVPLVSSYLLSARGVTGDGKTRTRAVISHLVEAYWDPLWDWLVGDREGIFKSSEEPCMELIITLVQSMEKRADIRMKFNDLLTKASLWDRYQLRICYQLFMRLCRDCPTNEETANFRSQYCFACMQYLSSSFTGKGNTKGTENVFDDALAHLESICKNSDAYIAGDKSRDSVWKSFVTNCLRYKFESAKVLTTLRCLIKAMYRKEPYDKKQSDTLLPLDTLYEMLISHSQFLDLLLSDGPSGNKDAKESLTELMVTIVDLSPSCCKSSHLPVLFAAYSASLSVTDQCILYLMSLYEKNHASFKDYRPFLWGPTAASHHQVSRSLGPSLWQQPSVTEVLELLDAKKMSQSTVLFPQTRLLQPQVHREVSQEKPQDVYDPCFLLPLFSCIMAPNYQVDCRKFVEQGCLSFTVASLSSRDTHVRQAGYHVLSRFMTHLEGSRFKERKQIFHLLKCLQNGITEANYRISSLMTCFVARVTFILLRREHPFYLMMNNFLLQRPALDIRNLPLFYSMFNSSTMQHVSERSWMLQLLVDGMKDSPDYYLYKRRHVIELALSYHDSPVSDQHSQNLVTELLQSTLKIHPAAYDLAKNFSIVAWIHSLCYKSPERLCTSLGLLHTLWFTLYHGSLEKKNESVEGNSRKELRQEWKAVRLPPNVAQECALVCWTMLENLRSRHNTSDTSTYLELLTSITNYLATTEQSFGLSRDRVVSLLCLWSASFDETMFLNQLLSSLKFSQGCDSSSSKNSPCADSDYRKAKTDSLSSLLTILTKWKPSPGEGANQTVLLVWWFGLACSTKSYINQETDNVYFQSDNNDTEHHLLSLLRWFRKCVLRDRELQDHLIHNPTTGKTLILQLYHVVLSHNKADLLQNTEGRRISSYELINEVNVICLVLFAAVQRILKQNRERPTSSQPAIFQLVSQEPYSNIISEGLEKVILPLLPDPRGEMEQGSCLPKQDCVLLDLVYLFMQEFWTERPIPRQFLSFLLSLSDTGSPVVDSLILALGGSKVIKKWVQKQVV
ncbi:nucleolar pre-ribosomal-associated protein 1 [Porites harrisoni]